MALTIFILSVILVALCVAGLALNILVKKNGAFPKTEIGANPHMRKLGIRCAKEEEISRLRLMSSPKGPVQGLRSRSQNARNPEQDGCSSCSCCSICEETKS